MADEERCDGRRNCKALALPLGDSWSEPKQGLGGIGGAGIKFLALSLTASCAYWRNLGICGLTICYGDLGSRAGHRLPPCGASYRCVIPRRSIGI